MASVFLTLLRRHLDESGMSQTAFGKAIELEKNAVSMVLKGTMKLPLDRIQKAADAFDLSGAERERFLVEGWLERSPEPLREWVRKEKGWMVSR
jgi:transcriptional regulator with XRE-family HTH domain